MQDKDLTPNSSFPTASTAKKPPQATQKWRILNPDNTTLLIDKQQLMSATETAYTYDSVKAFKKLDSKIKQF